MQQLLLVCYLLCIVITRVLPMVTTSPLLVQLWGRTVSRPRLTAPLEEERMGTRELAMAASTIPIDVEVREECRWSILGFTSFLIHLMKTFAFRILLLLDILLLFTHLKTMVCRSILAFTV